MLRGDGCKGALENGAAAQVDEKIELLTAAGTENKAIDLRKYHHASAIQKPFSREFDLC